MHSFFKKKSLKNHFFILAGIFLVFFILVWYYQFSIQNFHLSVKHRIFESAMSGDVEAFRKAFKDREFLTGNLNSVIPELASNTTSLVLKQKDLNTISIIIEGNQTPLNAGEVEISFDPTHFIVTGLEISRDLCEPRFVITKNIDNNQGTIFYQCGTTNPFTGTSTTLASIFVLPLKIGTSTISFAANTHVLAHDGFGTNIPYMIFNTTYKSDTLTNNDMPTLKKQFDVIQNE